MRLKPQNSAKELLEAELRLLRDERGRLAGEVTDLIHRQNELMAECKAKAEAEMLALEAVMTRCAEEKTSLRAEVEALEARKREALRPIDERHKELDEREARLTASRYRIEQKESELARLSQELTARLEIAADQRSEAMQMMQEAQRRRDALVESERMHKLSLEALNAKWVNFRKAEEETIAKLKEREDALSIREKANESEKKWLVAERDRNVAEKRALQSERAAITAAFEEGRRKKYL